jgi:hypothetical protein
MASFSTYKVVLDDKREELYLYYRGHLIYKAWYVAGQKQYSKVFYEGEGISNGAKAGVKRDTASE